MASRLRRNPRRGRVWYPPTRLEIPRPVSQAELVDRAYGDRGPKHGLRQRRDAIDTLWRAYRYLLVRATRENSADFATTAEQTIIGLAHELSRRGAKAWDPKLGEGLKGKQRRELLLHHRGRALAKLLDELAACGVLVWGGERDNHGLWWRLRIRLLDPDGPPPDPEPWMRGAVGEGAASGARSGAEAVREPRSGAAAKARRAGAAVNLGELYGRVEALTAKWPTLTGTQVVQLRTAAGRFARFAGHRPAGVSGDPMEVLLTQLEHHAPHAATALSWTLPRFDALTRRMEAAANAPSSPNCADLSNKLTPNVSQPSALAFTTSARGPVESDGVAEGATATEGSGSAETAITEARRDRAWEATTEALVARVAARERRLERLSGPRRAVQAETLARARLWEHRAPIPIALLTDVVEVLEGRRPWLSERQIERLRRGERRYRRYAGWRPPGAPKAPAAVLMALIESRPGGVIAALPWAITQLDLSKRMRREARRGYGDRRRGAARRRALHRSERGAAGAGAFYRRRADRHRELVDIMLEHVATGLLGRRARGETSARLRAIEGELRAVGHLPTTEPFDRAKQHGRTWWPTACAGGATQTRQDGRRFAAG